MLWVLLSLFSALTQSGKDYYVQRLAKNSEMFTGMAVQSTFAALFSLLAVLILGIPKIGAGFASAFIAEWIFEAIAFVFYYKALEKGDLSQTTPLMALTPLFLLLTSPLITQEVPSSQGVLGVLVGFGGIYLIALDVQQKNVLQPLLDLWRKRSLRYMLGVAAIYSLTANYYKLLTVNSSPAFASASLCTIMAVTFWIVWATTGKRTKLDWKMLRPAAISGFFGSVSGISLAYALKLAITPYVISLRRLSAITNVFVGHRVLREAQFKQRLLAAFLILVGSVLVIFAP